MRHPPGATREETPAAAEWLPSMTLGNLAEITEESIDIWNCLMSNSIREADVQCGGELKGKAARRAKVGGSDFL